MRRFLPLVLLLASLPVMALDGRVMLSTDETGTVWAGQQVAVHLDVKTNGFSFSNIRFNLPDVEGGFLLQVDSTTIKLSEQINGETWQVLRYPLVFFPQRSGRLEIPGIEIHFESSMGFGTTPAEFDLVTEELELDISWPPGAPENSLVVSTARFTMDSEWSTAGEPFVAGDAFTLMVTRRAQGISGMLLPPLPVFDLPGMAAYPDAPIVNDQSNRGALEGERIDRVTYIAEEAGSYTFPSVRFQWWDTQQQTLNSLLTDTLEATVAPAPVTDTATSGSTQDRSLSLAWVIYLLIPTLLVGLAWRFRQGLAGLAQQATRVIQATRNRILPPARALLPQLNPGHES